MWWRWPPRPSCASYPAFRRASPSTERTPQPRREAGSRPPSEGSPCAASGHRREGARFRRDVGGTLLATPPLQLRSLPRSPQQPRSKAVKQLKAELGVVIFDRIGRPSESAIAGRIVYSRAVELVSQSADLLTELAALRGIKRGLLRLGFPRLGSSALFAPMY